MKQKIARFAISVLVVLGVCFTPTLSSYAAEGGQVQTEGEVGFYTDKVPAESSGPGKTSTSSIPSTTGTKPAGLFPSTGELVKTGMTISGIVALVAALILFFWKRNKKQNEDESRDSI